MLHNATRHAARLHKTLHAARSPAAARRAMSSSLLRLGGVPEHFNLPVRKAAARPEPPFTWTEYPGGSGDLAAALRDGELDCAIMLTEAATLFANRGELKIIGAYVNTPLVWGVHAAADREVARDPPVYAISRYGSGSHLMALIAADSGQLARGPFEVVGSLDGAREALEEGRADYFLWEKFTTQPLVTSGEWRRADEVPTPWPCFAHVATPTVAAERAADIAVALEALWEESRAMPSLGAEIAEAYGQEPRMVAAWLESVAWGPGLRMPRAVLEKTTAALVAAGVLDAGDALPYHDVVADFTRDEALGAPFPGGA